MVGGVSLLRPWEPAEETPRLLPTSSHAQESSSNIQVYPGPSREFLDPFQVPVAITRAGASRDSLA